MNWHGYVIINLKSILHADLLSFYLMSMFCSRIPFRTPNRISSCLLKLLLSVTVSQTLLVFDDFDRFEEYWSDVLQNVSQLGFVVFLRIRLGLWTLGRKIILSRVHTITCWHIIVNLNLDHLAEVLFARLLCKVVLLPTPHAVSLEGSTLHSLHLRSGKLCFTSLRMDYLYKYLIFITGNVSISPIIYLLLFIYISMN